MKFLDLDALDPGYDEQFKPMIGWEGKGKSRKKVVFESKRRVHLDGYRYDGPGISVDRLKDWRRLERRAHELRTAARETWSKVEGIIGPLRREGQELFTAGMDDMLVRFSRDGYSITNMTTVLEGLEEDPDFFGLFVMLRPEDGGAEVCKLIHRVERLWTAHYKFQSAWRRGVQDRIQALHTREKWWEKDYYGEGRTFLVENEGRYHLLTWSHGKCGWVDGELYTTFKGETHV